MSFRHVVTIVVTIVTPLMPLYSSAGLPDLYGIAEDIHERTANVGYQIAVDANKAELIFGGPEAMVEAYLQGPAHPEAETGLQ
ncbi:MAG: hypothetical protein O2868_20780 [Proteobacteria bacterium]|jgi:hypothetical protein|nr:hypothetical protein [Pseudomonadota bacterium]